MNLTEKCSAQAVKCSTETVKCSAQTVKCSTQTVKCSTQTVKRSTPTVKRSTQTVKRGTQTVKRSCQFASDLVEYTIIRTARSERGMSRKNHGQVTRTTHIFGVALIDILLTSLTTVE